MVCSIFLRTLVQLKYLLMLVAHVLGNGQELALKKRKNSIVHSFNRNFAKRADGNPNTHAFVTSPEIVAAIAISGKLDFNPITDTLRNNKGEDVMLSEPNGSELPLKGFAVEDNGYRTSKDGSNVKVVVNPDSDRLQILNPFPEWDGNNIVNAKLLIKALENVQLTIFQWLVLGYDIEGI